MSRFKRPPGSTRSPKQPARKKKRESSFKIKLSGKDGAPLSMADLRQGLYDIAHKLAPYSDYRAKWVTLYLTMVDESGQEVLIDREGEWTLFPYQSAADEHSPVTTAVATIPRTRISVTSE